MEKCAVVCGKCSIITMKCSKCTSWFCSRHIQLERHSCPCPVEKGVGVVPEKIVAPKIIKF
jgi:predicted nucleic acid binding AN1-type Zn finger protein